MNWTIGTDFARQEIEKLEKQIKNAKEIIKMVIDSYNHKERFSFEKDLIKAEQFLKDLEKDKDKG